MSYKKHMVVPAEPNWYALDWCFKKDDTGIMITKEPIIAWAVTITEEQETVSTSIKPVTQDDLSSFHEGAIMRPDGTVCIAGVNFWNSFTDYLIDVKKRHFNNATTTAKKAEEVYTAQAIAEAANGSF